MVQVYQGNSTEETYKQEVIQTMNERHIAFSGHRPKLFGLENPYDYNQPFYQTMKKHLMTTVEQILQENQAQTIVGHSGMALGADLIWAQALVELKQKHPGAIQFVADLATPNQSNRWSETQKQIYQELLTNADTVVDHSKKQHAANENVFDARDNAMVENADIILAVFNPSLENSGTGKAINRAKEFNKQVVSFNPEEILKESESAEVTQSKIQQKNKRYTISLTGHRPDKLAGYDALNDLKNPYYQNMRSQLTNYLISKVNQGDSLQPIEVHSGMALGADTIWAQAIANAKAKLQKDGKDPGLIYFVADVPYEGQGRNIEGKKSAWSEEQVKMWQYIMDKFVDEERIVKEGSIGQQLNKRNQAMVDAADEILAIYSGDNDPINRHVSGTKNTITMAKNAGKNVIVIHPDEFGKEIRHIFLNKRGKMNYINSDAKLNKIHVPENQPTLSLLSYDANHLAGFNLDNKYYQTMYKSFQKTIENRLEKLEPDQKLILHSTLNQGADLTWGYAIADAKRKYPEKVHFVADVTSTKPGDNWPESVKNNYQNLLNATDEINVYNKADANWYENQNLAYKGIIRDSAEVLIIADKNQPENLHQALAYLNQNNTYTKNGETFNRKQKEIKPEIFHPETYHEFQKGRLKKELANIQQADASKEFSTNKSLAFLANDYPATIEMHFGEKTYTFPSVENAYQGLKDPAHIEEYTNISPQEAIIKGKFIETYPKDWSNQKNRIMSLLIQHKFEHHPALAEKLLSIQGDIVAQGPNIDNEWGVDANGGQNKLGQILMNERQRIDIQQNVTPKFKEIEQNKLANNYVRYNHILGEEENQKFLNEYIDKGYPYTNGNLQEYFGQEQYKRYIINGMQKDIAAKKQLISYHENGYEPVQLLDEHYPNEWVANQKDSPVVLFQKGNATLLNQPNKILVDSMSFKEKQEIFGKDQTYIMSKEDYLQLTDDQKQFNMIVVGNDVDELPVNANTSAIIIPKENATNAMIQLSDGIALHKDNAYVQEIKDKDIPYTIIDEKSTSRKLQNLQAKMEDYQKEIVEKSETFKNAYLENIEAPKIVIENEDITKEYVTVDAGVEL